MKGKVKKYLRELLKLGRRLSRKDSREKTVHRARVLARRLETLLSGNQKLIKKIRRLRKRLGHVREIDVHRTQWNKFAAGKPYFLTVDKQMGKDRKESLEEARSLLNYKKFKKLAKKAETNLIEKPNDPLKEKRLRKQMPLLVSKIRKNVVACLKTNQPDEYVHRIRIDVKRLRYSVAELGEIVGNHFPKALPPLKKMQTELGHLHDWETLESYLENLLKKNEDRWDRVAYFGAQKLSELARSEFEEHLKEWLKSWPQRSKVLKKLAGGK